MNAGRAALGAPNVQFPGLEVDIIPTQGHELAGSQAVAVGDQDGRGVPMAPAVFAGSLNELLDFPLGKVLARPSGSLNCYIYVHAAKCAVEMRDRRAARFLETELA